MLIQTYKSKIFFSLVGLGIVAIVSLGGYSYHLRTVLDTSEHNLKEAREQAAFLRSQKERMDKALDKQVFESDVLRRELIESLRRIQEDEEYQEWAPGKLPQNIIDEFKKPE